MSKPISEYWLKLRSEQMKVGALDASDLEYVARVAIRELQRTRVAIREHKQAVISGEIENDPEKSDTTLWRASLPEGEN